MNRGQEIAGELAGSGGDASAILEPAAAALDDVSASVGALVAAMDDDAAGVIGDDGFGAVAHDLAAKLAAGILFANDDRARGVTVTVHLIVRTAVEAVIGSAM